MSNNQSNQKPEWPGTIVPDGRYLWAAGFQVLLGLSFVLLGLLAFFFIPSRDYAGEGIVVIHNILGAMCVLAGVASFIAIGPIQMLRCIEYSQRMDRVERIKRKNKFDESGEN
jgi:hypothetical protein